MRRIDDMYASDADMFIDGVPYLITTTDDIRMLEGARNLKGIDVRVDLTRKEKQMKAERRRSAKGGEYADSMFT